MIPISEVDFGDFETQGLYKIAAEFPDSVTANLFLQIYRDSGVDVPEFLQVYLNAYVKDMQGQADDPGDADAQEDAPDSLPELPFDVKDVAPLGTLNFSDESLNTINTPFEQEGLPPPEGLESVHQDEAVAQGWRFAKQSRPIAYLMKAQYLQNRRFPSPKKRCRKTITSLHQIWNHIPLMCN